MVKAVDGAEHTIKWTDKTAVAGGKDVGDACVEGSKVSVKYTEKAGEKTAVGVKDVGTVQAPDEHLAGIAYRNLQAASNKEPLVEIRARVPRSGSGMFAYMSGKSAAKLNGTSS